MMFTVKPLRALTPRETAARKRLVNLEHARNVKAARKTLARAIPALVEVVNSRRLK